MRALLALALLTSSAMAQDHLRSARPQGFFGEGHAANHDHYSGLTNKQGGSCCNGSDCRPTTARWNAKTNQWEALVNGEWQAINNANLVLDDAWLQHINRPRWDTQSHVCASEQRGSDGNFMVWCLIPPGSGQ